MVVSDYTFNAAALFSNVFAQPHTFVLVLVKTRTSECRDVLVCGGCEIFFSIFGFLASEESEPQEGAFMSEIHTALVPWSR